MEFSVFCEFFCFTGIKEGQSLYNLWNRCYTAYRPIKTKVKKEIRAF